jgi:hypothetical protein
MKAGSSQLLIDSYLPVSNSLKREESIFSLGFPMWRIDESMNSLIM